MISVIVPVYNVEQYLPRCIESIIAQTYSDLEIILIDDGSTDNSGKICDNYSEKDNRIKVIHKKNGGLSDARNVGLDLCKGNYISFIDSDDYINIDMYNTMIRIAQKYNIDIVSCNYNHVYSNKITPFFSSFKDTLITNKTELFKLIFDYQNFDLVVFNKLYKATLFHNIRFPKGISPAEDLNILYPLISSSNRYFCLKETLYNKLERNNSLSHTTKIKDCINNVYAYERFLSNVKNDITLNYNTIYMSCFPTLQRHYKHLLDKIYLTNNNHEYDLLEKDTIKNFIKLYNDNNKLNYIDRLKLILLKKYPYIYKKYRFLSIKWKSLKQKQRTK